MPSKKNRAKAKKAERGDSKKLSESEVKVRHADRINKTLSDVAENFSSKFLMGRSYDGTSCRHGATDPISHRCQRLVDGVTEIFKEGIVDPEMLQVVGSELRGMTITSVLERFRVAVDKKKLISVTNGDFGYKEVIYNISYLSALGTELILNGESGETEAVSEMAYATIAPNVILMSMYAGIFGREKYSQFALNLANSNGTQFHESVAFFAKRVSCDCLGKKFNLRAIKNDASKAAVCSNCKETYSKKKLLVCSRCKCAHYCSKECQAKHWCEHKPLCDLFIKTVAKTDPLCKRIPWTNSGRTARSL